MFCASLRPFSGRVARLTLVFSVAFIWLAFASVSSQAQPQRAGGEQEQEFVQKNIVMTSEYAAKQIWNQIEREKPLHVFDRKTKFLAFMTRHLLPKSWVGKIYHQFVVERAPKRNIIKR